MALVFTVIRVLLGLFFTLAGAVKLTDQISEDVYKQLRSQFVQFAEVFPLRDLGVQPDPLLYLQVTGWVELLAGLLLAFGPRLLQTLSNLVLSVIMIGALFTLIKLGEPLSMCTPATVCLGLLLLLILRGSGPRGRRVKAD
ncbi:transmembrane protein 35B-like [Huso huso]|uniref:Transmembrane protein 35B-like n=1 Tax=Huso huso TaxID=61971 RepID=A0ABR0YP13_HUSHU